MRSSNDDDGVLKYDTNWKDRRVDMNLFFEWNFIAAPPPSPRSSRHVYLSKFTAAVNRICVKRLNSKDDVLQYLLFVFSFLRTPFFVSRVRRVITREAVSFLSLSPSPANISHMSNEHFTTRMISTNRNIRQRCQLKYSRHGRLNWVDRRRELLACLSPSSLVFHID